MLLSPLAAVALQVPLLAAVAAAVLRGQPIVRWLRLLLVGLAWLLVQVLAQPLVVTDDGPLAELPVVPALVVAGMVVALFAAGNDARDERRGLARPLSAVLLLTASFLLAPEAVGLAAALLGWTVGTLRLGWILAAGARRHPGSLLAARLRMLAAAQVLLASAALSVFGGPFPFSWVPALGAGAGIVAAAVALPRAIRIVPRRTRDALRRVDTEIVAIGAGEVIGPAALRSMIEHVRLLFGAEAVALTDGGRRVAAAGDEEVLPTSSHPRSRRHLAVSTGRGKLLLVLPPVGLLLTRSDRDQAAALAERLGLVLTRDDARRADARAAAARAAADRVRDDVVSTLSHELRTPLTAVMGFAEVLHRHGDRLSTDEHDLLLARIADRSRHLEELVAALLDLTAVRGRGTAAGEPRELAELVDLAVHRVGRVDRFDVDVPGHPVRLRTDARAVVEVLEELLRNAGKFGPTDGRIGLRAEVVGDDVVIEVRNGGAGLRELGDRAFEPFTRGGDVLTRATGGLGIGLTIARELARQLGGSLAAADVADVADGACVRFVLPRHHEFAAMPALPSPLAAIDSAA